MEELRISYATTKNQRMTNVVIFSYFTLFGLYFVITQALISNYKSLIFIGSAILSLLAIILLLKNTLWLPAPLVNISNEKIEANLSGQKKILIDWATVSNINIGQSYIVFFTNGGQKQRKLELAELKYNDLLAVKSKVIELCEHKNISYRND
ncbi:hypothetical protein GGR21_003743 [Dysgonomonas hofstadii]|uniref:Uncharacterized protein n=1 Tax=Dysgonomonas hofstadii TaxID=637886 RepID=A0A840CZJ5_9BACT|nr:hypothetical protein [Dysgonomonas hofstadii]MBB4037822.1 hypothetical protein [Dysgonomonas hofstadii]